MIEKRRSSRIPVQLHLSISDIYNQDNSGIHNLESPIEVVDISIHGVGLISECILPLNYYFNASLTIEEENLTAHAVVKILRVDVHDKDVYLYGCEFVELNDEAKHLITRYQV